MKKSLFQVLTFIILVFSTQFSFGQLKNETIFPNFTITDIDGKTHDLYQNLNEGKTVYLDFFAAHCGACWKFHKSEAMNNLNIRHGKDGTISKDVIVIGIDCDENNGINELKGISGYKTGDWITGTSFPICNPEGDIKKKLFADFAVNYYPLVYAVCPNKKVTVLGTITEAELYSHIGNCKMK